MKATTENNEIAANKTIIFTEKAPVPLGTYSQGVKVGNTIYLAAQTPVVPGTNDIAEGGFEGQLRQTFSNLNRLLKKSPRGQRPRSRPTPARTFSTAC